MNNRIRSDKMGQLMTSRAAVLWSDPVLRRFAAGNIGSLSIVSTQLLCCSHRGIRKAAGSPLRCSLSLQGRIPPLLGAIMALPLSLSYKCSIWIQKISH